MKFHITFCRFIVFFILTLVITKNNFGQGVGSGHSLLFMSDITGKPINLKSDYNINGNPYFPDNYTISTLYLKGGGKIENVKAKIYLPDHSILYFLNDSADMVAVSVIEKIEFSYISREQPKTLFVLLPSAEKSKVENKYYQVLDSGKVLLLKLYTSDFTDAKEFGSATVTRTYEKRADFFTYTTATGINKISSLEKLLSTVFSNKQKEMDGFASENKISIKKEKDLKKLFLYYKSL